LRLRDWAYSKNPNPTTDDQRSLEIARRRAERIEEERKQMRRDIIRKFSPEDHKAWQDEHDAEGRAFDKLIEARSELRAAENALEQTQQAAATK
jgi:hypothetical protein